MLAELERRRRAAHAELARALRSDDVPRAARRAGSAWLTDPDVAPADDRRLGPFVAERIAKAQRKVLTDGRAITPASPAERLHDLRKDTKKLRYLLECFGSLFPTKGRKAFVAQLKALQDNLGEHQDAEVHLAQLRELAHDLHARADRRHRRAARHGPPERPARPPPRRGAGRLRRALRGLRHQGQPPRRSTRCSREVSGG